MPVFHSTAADAEKPDLVAPGVSRFSGHIELLIGTYFAATVYYSIQNENYLTAPFLLLFVWGYLYTGLMSLGQGWIERYRVAVGTPEEIRAAAPGVPV